LLCHSFHWTLQLRHCLLRFLKCLALLKKVAIYVLAATILRQRSHLF
jgi:hypothetical protein